METNRFPDKSDIRQKARSLRHSLSDEDIREKSRHITDRLLGMPIAIKADTFCIYASTRFEVRTDEIIGMLLERKKCVCIPKIDGETLSLNRIFSLSDLTVSKWGLKEPDSSGVIPRHDVDVFIIPGLAFDRFGTRLGFGKGYYDRLLENVRGYKIGLAFASQIFRLLPKTQYDIVMDALVTERKILYP